MSIRFTLLSLASAMALGGCASSNNLITAKVNPTNGAPAYRAPLAAPAPQLSPLEVRDQAIRNAEDQALADILIYRKVPGSVVFDAKVERVNKVTTFTVTATPKGFFGAGQYALEKIQRSEDRSGAVFMDLVSGRLRKMVDDVKAQTNGELNVTFHATYSAQADGVPVRSNLIYKGDYGEIRLPSTITTVNGKPTDIRIKKGQAISNEELAGLRAVSLATFVHGAMQPYPITDKFVLTTTDARGPDERWIKLEVTIAPAL